MKIITVAAVKGGTGKTTTATALAQAGASKKKKVLAVDMDAQSNLTFALNGDSDRAGVYELLEGAAPAADLIQTTPQGVDLLPARADLAAVKTSPGSAGRLQRALEEVSGQYDLIIIDTPPATGELQNNALFAATDLLIPLETDINSLQGLYSILDIAHHIQERRGRLGIAGVILTRYDARPKLSQYLRDTIAEKAGEAGTPLLMEIRAGVAIREAMAMQESLYQYAPKSKPAQDYLALYKKLTGGRKR